jgi:pimeloyl-ACP methyl ester carboxylesterase
MLSVPLLAGIIMKLQPPSPKQVEQLAKMVREHPLVPELADLLLATEKLPQFESTFLPTLHTLLRLRGPRPELALTADQLARITQPVKLIWGHDDPFGPQAAGERAAAMMPNAEFHLVGGGHAPWVTRAGRIGPIVKPFLQKHSES